LDPSDRAVSTASASRRSGAGRLGFNADGWLLVHLPRSALTADRARVGGGAWLRSARGSDRMLGRVVGCGTQRTGRLVARPLGRTPLSICRSPRRALIQVKT